MQKTFLFTLLFFLIFSNSVAAVPTTNPPTVTAYANMALLEMRLAMRSALEEGRIPKASAECMLALDESSFRDVYFSIISEGLSNKELEATEAFFRSPVGQKFAKQNLLKVHADFGRNIPEPLPSYSDAESEEFKKFAPTDAGDKLLTGKLFKNPEAKQKIGEHRLSLLVACRKKKF